MEQCFRADWKGILAHDEEGRERKGTSTCFVTFWSFHMKNVGEEYRGLLSSLMELQFTYRTTHERIRLSAFSSVPRDVRPSPRSIFRAFPPPQEEPCAFSHHCLLCSKQTLSVFPGFPIPDISHEWNEVTCGPWCLAPVTEHHVFNIRPCRSRSELHSFLGP